MKIKVYKNGSEVYTGNLKSWFRISNKFWIQIAEKMLIAHKEYKYTVQNGTSTPDKYRIISL